MLEVLRQRKTKLETMFLKEEMFDNRTTLYKRQQCVR
mgnify:CR=1 FL=1